MLIRCPECDTVYDIEKRLLKNGGRNLKCSNCSHHWFEPTPAARLAKQAQTKNHTPRYLDPAFDDPEIAKSVNLLRNNKIARNNLTETPLGNDGLSRKPSYSKGAASFMRNPNSQNIKPPAAAVKRAIKPPSAGARNLIQLTHTKTKENWVAMLGLAMIAISFSSVFGMRDGFSRAFPDLVSLYSRIGFDDVNVLGVDIVDVTTEAVNTSNGPALNISGQLINVSGNSEPIPPLQVVLSNEAGEHLYTWAFAAGATIISDQQSIAFDTTLVDTPPDAVSITVQFVDENG